MDTKNSLQNVIMKGVSLWFDCKEIHLKYPTLKIIKCNNAFLAIGNDLFKSKQSDIPLRRLLHPLPFRYYEKKVKSELPLE